MFSWRDLVIYFCSFLVIVQKSLGDVLTIERLVRHWAPLIWLSPEEKFMPLDVGQFLENMNLADGRGNPLFRFKHSDELPPFNAANARLFLIPSSPIEKLKSDRSSFIYGKNPIVEQRVPIYAVVTECGKPSDGNHTFMATRKLYPSFHVTYWTFYPYNEGKDVCFLGKFPAPLFKKCFGHYRKLGNHIGDWEHMSLSFRGHSYPEKLFLSVHDTGAYYNYDRYSEVFIFDSMKPRKGVQQVPSFPEYVRLQGGHPVLFAAKGSHGLWSSPGEHTYIKIPRISDSTDYGTPWKTWASVKTFLIGKSVLPTWMTFPGKWGNPKSKCVLLSKLGVCEYSEGPQGLLRENKVFEC